MVVLALLVAGCEPGLPTGMAISDEILKEIVDQAHEVVLEEVIVEVESAGMNESPVFPGTVQSFATIKNFNFSNYGLIITLTGTLIDGSTGAPIEGGKIALYCDGVEITKGDPSTTETGDFEISTKSDCGFGQYLWVGIDHDGKTYESKHVMIPRLLLYGSGSGGSGSSPREVLKTSSVPEFTPVTFILAMTLVALGIGAIRKR